jgi:hypothetical protein
LNFWFATDILSAIARTKSANLYGVISQKFRNYAGFYKTLLYSYLGASAGSGVRHPVVQKIAIHQTQSLFFFLSFMSTFNAYVIFYTLINKISLVAV